MNLRTCLLLCVLFAVKAGHAETGMGSITFTRVGGTPPPAAPAAPPVAQPAPPAEVVAPLPDCKSGKYSVSLKEIDGALQSSTKYQRAFNKNYDLVEDPITSGFNACHASIEWNNRPEIQVSQCAFGFSPKPAMACQLSDHQVRFVEIVNGQGGVLAAKPMVVDFELAPDGRHWTVHSPSLPKPGYVTLKEAQVTR